MGLPGSGKTWLAERLQKYLDCAWYNADKVREMANDWDFSEDARIRQARRMTNIADYEKGCGRTVICDFICPTELTRFIYDADITIWMNTIVAGRFLDTNKMFEEPVNFDYIIEKFMSDEQILELANKMKETYGI
jgi:adenylylsulfate kinase